MSERRFGDTRGTRETNIPIPPIEYEVTPFQYTALEQTVQALNDSALAELSLDKKITPSLSGDRTFVTITDNFGVAPWIVSEKNPAERITGRIQAAQLIGITAANIGTDRYIDTYGDVEEERKATEQSVKDQVEAFATSRADMGNFNMFDSFANYLEDPNRNAGFFATRLEREADDATYGTVPLKKFPAIASALLSEQDLHPALVRSVIHSDDLRSHESMISRIEDAIDAINAWPNPQRYRYDELQRVFVNTLLSAALGNVDQYGIETPPNDHAMRDTLGLFATFEKKSRGMCFTESASNQYGREFMRDFSQDTMITLLSAQDPKIVEQGYYFLGRELDTVDGQQFLLSVVGKLDRAKHDDLMRKLGESDLVIRAFPDQGHMYENITDYLTDEFGDASPEKYASALEEWINSLITARDMNKMDESEFMHTLGTALKSYDACPAAEGSFIREVLYEKVQNDGDLIGEAYSNYYNKWLPHPSDDDFE